MAIVQICTIFKIKLSFGKHLFNITALLFWPITEINKNRCLGFKCFRLAYKQMCYLAK